MPVSGYAAYIKISKIDKNGVNQTITLQSLDKLTIPYSTGNITYNILEIVEKPTYFQYYIQLQDNNVEFADRAELGYSFSSSYDGAQSTPFLGIPQLTSTLDNQGFFLEGGLDNNGLGSNASPLDSYRILTYPQKDINIRASSSIQFEIEAKNATTSVTASVRICSTPLNIGLTPGFSGTPQPTVLASTLLSSSLQDLDSSTFIFTGSYDLTAIISASSFNPGDCVYFQIFPQVDGDGPFIDCSLEAPITFTNGLFNISSSDTTGTEFGIIPEPYFGDNDFLKALDCQPLLNNANNNRFHNLYQDIDYSAGATEPVNFDVLINGTATRAEVQLSNYTQESRIIPRYKGSRTTSQKLNVWTKGDVGTFGKTPTISVLDSNIYEFEWGGGTTPEIPGLGSLKIGKILQVGNKNAVKTIQPNEGLSTIVVNYNYPAIYNRSSSISKNVSDYYYVLDSNVPFNENISLQMYPNSTAGSNPVIPKITKVLTTNFGVPTNSSYVVTSSNGYKLDNNKYIELNNADKTFVQSLNSSYGLSGTQGSWITGSTDNVTDVITNDLNNGERWFVTLFQNNISFPFNSSTLIPENRGFTIGGGSSLANDGRYEKSFDGILASKGVFEILGLQQINSTLVKLHTRLTFTDPPYDEVNVGSMLIWKARSVGKNDFIIVQDEITGGVGPGAFTTQFTTKEIKDNFDEITKTYGTNTN